MRRLQFIVLCPALAVTACETIESQNVRTDGIHADLRATADGDGQTRLSASLRAGDGSNTFIELNEGDRLVAYWKGEEETMDEEHVLGSVHYEAAFPTNEGDTQFRIGFLREAHDDAEEKCRGGDAPNSEASLPAPFTLTGPGSSGSLSRAASLIEVRWSPSGSGDRMDWQLSGPCVTDRRGSLSGDPGLLTISPGTLEPISETRDEACSVELSIRRTRSGSVDPAYGEGGSFTAEQLRTLRFVSAP